MPIILYMEYMPCMVHYTEKPAWYSIVNLLEEKLHVTAIPEYAFHEDQTMIPGNYTVKRKIEVFGSNKELINKFISRQNKLMNEHFSYMKICYSLD